MRALFTESCFHVSRVVTYTLGVKKFRSTSLAPFEQQLGEFFGRSGGQRDHPQLLTSCFVLQTQLFSDNLKDFMMAPPKEPGPQIRLRGGNWSRKRAQH
jgi:hypothetical protein